MGTSAQTLVLAAAASIAAALLAGGCEQPVGDLIACDLLRLDPDGHQGVPAAVLLGIPMHAHATGVIPVAEAMLGNGLAIGTTLALIMSVAAPSMPELLIAVGDGS
jgi:hypothetical protein